METFKSRVLYSSEKINLELIDGGRMMNGQDVAAGLIDWRYIHVHRHA